MPPYAHAAPVADRPAPGNSGKWSCKMSTIARYRWDPTPARSIGSWPIARALRSLCDVLREAVAAHRRYEWLRSRGVPHDTALKEALSIGHSASECSALPRVLTHRELPTRSAISS